MTPVEMIRLMIVDGNEANLSKLNASVADEPDIYVAALAASADEAVHQAQSEAPHVIVMDFHSAGVDGFAAGEALAQRLPGIRKVMVLPNGQTDAAVLMRVMQAGVDEFLVKPFSGAALAASVRRAYRAAAPAAGRAAVPEAAPHNRNGANGNEAAVTASAIDLGPSWAAPPLPATSAKQGQLLAVCSASGGVGRSTLAANLAIALQSISQENVVLVDASLRYGDIGALLNLRSERTIVDVCTPQGGADVELLPAALASHPTGVKVLLAPNSPEFGDLVTPAALGQMLKALRAQFSYVVVDTYVFLDEAVLTILDLADQLLLVTTGDLTVVKNTKLLMLVSEMMDYTPGKIRLVVNRHDPKGLVSVRDVELSLEHPVFATITRDDRLTTQAIQTGQPFVVSQRAAPISQAIYELAGRFAAPVAAPPAPRRRGLFRR